MNQTPRQLNLRRQKKKILEDAAYRESLNPWNGDKVIISCQNRIGREERNCLGKTTKIGRSRHCRALQKSGAGRRGGRETGLGQEKID